MRVSHHRSHRPIMFLLTCIFVSFAAWFFNTIPPKQGSVIAFGIFLIVCILFFFLYGLTNNVRRSLLWSSGGGIFLALRAAKLHDPIYSVLLFALLVSIEFAMKKPYNK